MSLTSELASGPLAAWFRDRFPGADTAAAVVGGLVNKARCVPAAGAVSRRHWSAVGAAVSTRLGWAAEPAPPYYALLGAHRAGLIGWDAVNRAAASFPTHRGSGTGLPPQAAPEQLLAWRPTPAGWVDTAPPPAQRPTFHQGGTHGLLVADFARRTGTFLDRVPRGEHGTAGEETVLARAALVLADWEDAYRGDGRLPAATRTALDHARTAGDAAELLHAVEPAELADTAAILEHARRSGLLEQLAAAAEPGSCGRPRGHAFPTFVEQWADGDLILEPANGSPTTLIDVKTVMGPRNPSTVQRWLWQLLGYALLVECFAPEWRLGRVGLCFARHAHVVSWQVEELAGALAGERPRAWSRARGEFDQVFRETLAARGLTAVEPG